MTVSAYGAIILALPIILYQALRLPAAGLQQATAAQRSCLCCC